MNPEANSQQTSSANPVPRHARLGSIDVPPEVELEDRQCPLGCLPDDQIVLNGVRDRLHNLPGQYRVVRCRECGLMRTNPRPTPETIGYYYPDDYGPYHSNATARIPAAASQTLVQRIVRRFFDERHTYIPNMPVGRVLEVGCASGQFLTELRNKGWDAQGIEFNAEAAMRARALGFPVHIGQLEQAPAPVQPYDLVIGWMVLEHLHEPVAALRKLHEWTRSGAMLALSVPDCGAWEISAFRQYWYALHIPNHLYHFNRKTLSNVLKAGGWTLVEVQNHRDLWPVRSSIMHLIEDPNAVSQPVRRLLEWVNRLLTPGWFWRPLAALLAPLGQTCGMTVVARRSTEQAPPSKRN
jgi:SAM-dependent methyltransferase